MVQQMNDKIAFLNRYTLSSKKKVEFITDKSTILNAPIPEYWKAAFLADTLEDRKSVVLGKWQKYLARELSNTILYLQTYLTDIELMRIGEEYSILYTVLSYKTKKIAFYEGGNPLSESNLGEKFDYPVEDIDKTIVDFYTKVHNGFYYYPSKTMGLDSTENIDSMTDFEWEYEDQLEMDLTSCYNFFSNGMGTYIVLDLTKNIENGAYLWSTKELPKGKLNFWDFTDEWIIIGLDF